MKTFTALALLYGLAVARAITINVAAGADFEADCLHKVQPGDTCYLEKGDYLHDGLTVTHGTAEQPITITGDSSACIKGSNTQDRAFQVAHDYYILDGICFDGDHDGEYVATAVYVLGEDMKTTKNGVTSSVTGLQMLNLEIRNFGSECIHFRYYVTHAEVYGCTIQNCGVDDFVNGGGAKVGEGLYMGTALDQINDNKAPEVKLRSGSADNIDADECAYNKIHFNTIRTYGNECVDIKEGSHSNIVEENVCEFQKDENSGGFGVRGSYNTVRYNAISNCVGAAVRLGGDKGYGMGNNIYGNEMNELDEGAFNLMSDEHGTICGNTVSAATLAIGTHKDTLPNDALENCATTPGDYDHFDFFPSRSATPRSEGDSPSGSEDSTDSPSASPSASPTDSPTDRTGSEELIDEGQDAEPGVNGAATPSPLIDEVQTNTLGVTGDDGECAMVLDAGKVQTEYSQFIDGTTDMQNLFDGNLESYFSVHRESTTITLELDAETTIEGVAIGFFIKNGEDRIQTFDVSVKAGSAEDWTTVISGEESDGSSTMQHFAFTSPQQALYVQFKSRGNTFNNWTALTEFHVCGVDLGETNALFGGARAVGHELQELTGGVCPAPFKLTPRKVRSSGKDNVAALFDGNFDTRWTTQETQQSNDLMNGQIILRFIGDQNVAWVKMAFFDGRLAKQHFSIYKQSSSEKSWTLVLDSQLAERKSTFQTFYIGQTGVNVLYIVGHGNDVGDYTKISELEVYGC